MVEPGAVLSRVTWRLIPFLFLLYIVNILDRVNVGFAKLQMLPDLGMDETVYALGAGIFYILRLMSRSPQPGEEGPERDLPVRAAGLTPSQAVPDSIASPGGGN